MYLYQQVLICFTLFESSRWYKLIALIKAKIDYMGILFRGHCPLLHRPTGCNHNNITIRYVFQQL